MALVKCSHCGKDYSDLLSVCKYCNNRKEEANYDYKNNLVKDKPKSKHKSETLKWSRNAVLIGLGIWFISYLILGGNNNAKHSEFENGLLRGSLEVDLNEIKECACSMMKIQRECKANPEKELILKIEFDASESKCKKLVEDIREKYKKKGIDDFKAFGKALKSLNKEDYMRYCK